MDKRNVGKSGLRVSSIGLGCNNFGWLIDAASSKQIIRNALDLGVSLFDTAPVYGKEWGASETILGSALGEHRKDVIIVSKFGLSQDKSGRNTSRAAVVEGIEASLRRLGTDYIDLFMLHWPDHTTPMQETLRALDDVISSGKARYIGCCNLPAWRVVESRWLSTTGDLHEFIVTQDEYSLAHRAAERSLLPALDEYGMGLMPYAPLANGLLTGKYSSHTAHPTDSRLGNNVWNTGDRYLTQGKLALAEQLNGFAQERGHTLLELAVSWLLARPAVCSVIAGATRPQHVQQNSAAGAWQLSRDELDRIDQICRDTGNMG